MTPEEQILVKFPLCSYSQDREEHGRVILDRVEETRILAQGVQYRKCLYRRGKGEPVWVYLILVSPGASARLAVSAAPRGTIKMVKRHAEEFEGRVICAMNAGYFHFFRNGDLTPYGIQIVRGEELSPPGKDLAEYSNHWVGVTQEGQVVIGTAEEYFQTWKGKLEYAVGGGMRLIQNGKIRLHRHAGAHPRTAVGLAKDGTLILLSADGRTAQSVGLTYGDLIDLFTGLEYEIEELLNLDGGGSTTLVLRNEDGKFWIPNVPSGPPLPLDYVKYDLPKPEPRGASQARAVADCILLVEAD